jgi:hypothetical protein
MGKHIEHKQAKDEQSLSDQEIWWKIRYLDPDIKRRDSVSLRSFTVADYEIRVGTNRTVIGTASESDTQLGRERVSSDIPAIIGESSNQFVATCPGENRQDIFKSYRRATLERSGTRKEPSHLSLGTSHR